MKVVEYMRLWHEDLIGKLPRQQLIGQHRECCALRGKGWGKKHSTVDYVFKYSPCKLYTYHMKVIEEMHKRGYHNDPLWEDSVYRGKHCSPYNSEINLEKDDNSYPEHDQNYYEECCANLAQKGIYL